MPDHLPEDLPIKRFRKPDREVEEARLIKHLRDALQSQRQLTEEAEAARDKWRDRAWGQLDARAGAEHRTESLQRQVSEYREALERIAKWNSQNGYSLGYEGPMNIARAALQGPHPGHALGVCRRCNLTVPNACQCEDAEWNQPALTSSSTPEQGT